MNRNKDPMLRALYIILVPIVLLIILLNSGMLQRWIPAVRVHGQNYSVVRYNYYYFDYYNAFLEENEDRLDELGYDPAVSESQQLTADGLTWKEFFQRQAEANMAETAYYCALAAGSGYEFSEEELLPVGEKLAENAERQAASNISAKNWYTAYYGAGMTEAAYTQELTRQVEARVYKAHLIRSSSPSRAEIDAYIAENNIPDYSCLNLRVITLAALPDRETGLVGPEQLDALRQKLQRLAARYENGESFESLQKAFSTCAMGDQDGVVAEASRGELPPYVARWLTQPEGPAAGKAAAGVDEDTGTGYFVIVDGYGGSGPEREARLSLGENALREKAAEMAEGYAVNRLSFGMLLATA